MKIHPIWNDYPEINNQLLKVDQVIQSHIRIKDKKVRAIINDVVDSGGKLLRPAYALLCSQIGPEQDEDKALAIAAALETLHIATLIHDRSEEHTSELQSRGHLVCRLLLETQQ